MDRLACLQVFLEVANAGSFARAAMKLSVAKSTVTKQVAWLEATMGAQLLNRSAKQVTMTEAGRRVLEASTNLLESYESMTSEVRESTRSPKGIIRIGTPPSFGTYHLIPAVTRFTERYPEIEVIVMFDDERTSSVSESLDLSIRILPSLEDTSSVALPLMSSPQVLVASPAYLKRYGRPRDVRHLERHNCLVHTLKAQSSIWNFNGDPPQSVRVRGSLKSNMGDALKQAAILGCGISMHPIYMVSREIETGLLEVVLPECTPQAKAAIYALYSTRRNLPLRVRCLLDFLKEWAHSPATRSWTGQA
ncbi:LysR family transcriptional regulator [Ottowia thiooxydans]|uniref:LysR family transcriptional regulator n=1 Tax=Ottowia thiooxydans TaxID=219182 RepID=UPI00042A46BD|nr:LysR family transcriptional regulator [Ottowia thiooxydans]